jgi:hypothetical protein
MSPCSQGDHAGKRIPGVVSRIVFKSEEGMPVTVVEVPF